MNSALLRTDDTAALYENSFGLTVACDIMDVIRTTPQFAAM